MILTATLQGDPFDRAPREGRSAGVTVTEDLGQHAHPRGASACNASHRVALTTVRRIGVVSEVGHEPRQLGSFDSRVGR